MKQIPVPLDTFEKAVFLTAEDAKIFILEGLKDRDLSNINL